MKFTLKKMAAAKLLAVISTGAMAAPVAIDTMYASTGSWNEGGAPGTPSSWVFSGADIDLTAANNQSYGSSFTFFGAPVYVFSGDGTYAPYGGAAVAGGPTISGTVDAETGTITVNMSSWTMRWDTSSLSQDPGSTGFTWNQGNPSVTGTWNSTTGAYNIAWSSLMLGGPFDGSTGNWTLQGTAVAVPEADTWAMLLVGIGLVGVVAWRRKQTA